MLTDKQISFEDIRAKSITSRIKLLETEVEKKRKYCTEMNIRILEQEEEINLHRHTIIMLNNLLNPVKIVCKRRKKVKV